MPKKYILQYDPNSKEKNERNLFTSSFRDHGLSVEAFTAAYGENSGYAKNADEVGLSDATLCRIFNAVRSYMMQEYVHHWEHEEWYENAKQYPGRGGYTLSQEEYDAKASTLNPTSSVLYEKLCRTANSAQTPDAKQKFDRLLSGISSRSHMVRQLSALEVPDLTPQKIAEETRKNNTFVAVEVLPESFSLKDENRQPDPELLPRQQGIGSEATLRKAFVHAGYSGAFDEKTFNEDYVTAQEDAFRLSVIRQKQPVLLDPAEVQNAEPTLADLRGDNRLHDDLESAFLQEGQPVNDKFPNMRAEDLYLDFFGSLPHAEPDSLPKTDEERAEDEAEELARNHFARVYAELKKENRESDYQKPSSEDFSAKVNEFLHPGKAPSEEGNKLPNEPDLIQKRRAERADLGSNPDWNRYWTEDTAKKELAEWKDSLRSELTERYEQEFSAFHKKNWSVLFRPEDISRYGDSLRNLWQNENREKIQEKIENTVDAKIKELTDEKSSTYRNWLSSVQDRWLSSQEGRDAWVDKTIKDARSELKMDEPVSRNVYRSSDESRRRRLEAQHQERLAHTESMTQTIDRLNRGAPADDDVIFYDWLKARTTPEQLDTLQERLRRPDGRQEYRELKAIFNCSHGPYQENVQKTEKVTASLFAPVVPEKDPLSPFVIGAFTDQSVADEDLLKAHEMCRSIPLNGFLESSWDKAKQVPIESKDIETVVAGAFLREDVLGLLANTTFHSYENTSGAPLKPVGNSDLEKMLDPFFNLTVGGDTRRVANLPRVAAPRARGLAGSVLKAYTDGNPRPLVDCLDNMIRVSANYARKHPTNDHSVYASSKMASDALALMEKAGLKKYSSLNLDELREAQAAATRYKAQSEIASLRTELADTLMENHLAKLAPENHAPDPLQLNGVGGKIIRLKALEGYCSRQALYAKDPGFFMQDAPDPEHPEQSTSFRYLSPEEMSASLDFDSYLSVLQEKPNVQQSVRGLSMNSSAQDIAAALDPRYSQVSVTASRFTPDRLKKNVDFLKGNDIRPTGTQLLRFADETAAYPSERQQNPNARVQEKSIGQKFMSLFGSDEPAGTATVKDIEKVTQRVRNLGFAIQQLNTLALEDPVNLYSSKDRLQQEYAFYSYISDYDSERFRKDYARVLNARVHQKWIAYSDEAGENLINEKPAVKEDYDRVCQTFEQMKEAAASWKPLLSEQIRIREDSERAAQMLLNKTKNSGVSSPYKVGSVDEAWKNIQSKHGNIDLSDYLMRQREANEAPASVKKSVAAQNHLNSVQTKKLQTLRSLATNQTLDHQNPVQHEITGNFQNGPALQRLQTKTDLKQSFDVLQQELRQEQNNVQLPQQDKPNILSLATQKLSFEDRDAQPNEAENGQAAFPGGSEKYAGIQNFSTLKSLNTMTREKFNRSFTLKKGQTFIRTNSTIIGADLGGSRTGSKTNVPPQASGYGSARNDRAFQNMAPCDQDFALVALGRDPLIPAKFLASKQELNEAVEGEAYSRRVFPAMLSKQAMHRAQLAFGVAGKTVPVLRELQNEAKEEAVSIRRKEQDYRHRQEEKELRQKKNDELQQAEREKQKKQLSDSQKREKIRRAEVSDLEKFSREAGTKQEQALKDKHTRYTAFREHQRKYNQKTQTYELEQKQYELDIKALDEKEKFYAARKTKLAQKVGRRSDVIRLEKEILDNRGSFMKTRESLQKFTDRNYTDRQLDPKNVIPEPQDSSFNIMAERDALLKDQQALQEKHEKELTAEKNRLEKKKQELEKTGKALAEEALQLEREKLAVKLEQSELFLTELENVEDKVALKAKKDLSRALKEEPKEPQKLDVIEEDKEEDIEKDAEEAEENEEIEAVEDADSIHPAGEKKLLEAAENEIARNNIRDVYKENATHDSTFSEKWHLIAPNADRETREMLTENANQTVKQLLSARNLMIQKAPRNNPTLLPLFKDALNAYNELLSGLTEEIPDPNVQGKKALKLKEDPVLPAWLTEQEAAKRKPVDPEKNKQEDEDEIFKMERPSVSPQLLALKACSDFLLLDPEKQKSVRMKDLTKDARDSLQPLVEEGIENFTLQKLSSCCTTRPDWEKQREQYRLTSTLDSALREYSSSEPEVGEALLVRKDTKAYPGQSQETYLRDLSVARIELQNHLDSSDSVLKALAKNALQECEKLEKTVSEYQEPLLIHESGKPSSALLSMYIFNRALKDHNDRGSVLSENETFENYIAQCRDELDTKTSDLDSSSSFADFRSFLPTSSEATEKYQASKTTIPLLEDSLRELAQHSASEDNTFRYITDRTATLYRDSIARMEQGQPLDDLLYEYRKDQDGSYRVVPTESYVLASICKDMISEAQKTGMENALKDFDFGQRIADKYTSLAQKLDEHTIKPSKDAPLSEEENLKALQSKVGSPESVRSRLLIVSVQPTQKTREQEKENEVYEKGLQIGKLLTRVSEEGYLATKGENEKAAPSSLGRSFHRLLASAASGYQMISKYAGDKIIQHAPNSTLDLFVRYDANRGKKGEPEKWLDRPRDFLLDVVAANLMLRDMEKQHNENPSAVFRLDDEAFDLYHKQAARELMERRTQFSPADIDSGKNMEKTLEFLSPYIWKDLPGEEKFFTALMRYNRAVSLAEDVKECELRKEEIRSEIEEKYPKDKIRQDDLLWYKKQDATQANKDKSVFVNVAAKKKEKEQQAQQHSDTLNKELNDLDSDIEKLKQNSDDLQKRKEAENKVLQNASVLLAKETSERDARKQDELQKKVLFESRLEIFLMGRTGNAEKERKALENVWFSGTDKEAADSTENLQNLGIDPDENASDISPTRNELLLECSIHSKVLDAFLRQQENPDTRIENSEDRAFLVAAAKNAKDAYDDLFTSVSVNGAQPAQFFDENGLPSKSLSDIALARSLFSFSNVTLNEIDEPDFVTDELIAPFAEATRQAEKIPGFYDDLPKDEIVQQQEALLENKQKKIRTIYQDFKEANPDLGKQEPGARICSALSAASADNVFRELYPNETQWIHSPDPNTQMPALTTPENRAKQNSDFLFGMMTENRSMTNLGPESRSRLLESIRAQETAQILYEMQPDEEPGKKLDQSAQVDQFLQIVQRMSSLTTSIRESVSSHDGSRKLSNLANGLDHLTNSVVAFHGFKFDPNTNRLTPLPNGAKMFTQESLDETVGACSALLSNIDDLSKPKSGFEDLASNLNEIRQTLELDLHVLRSLAPDPAQPKTLTEQLQNLYEKTERERVTLVFDEEHDSLSRVKSPSGLALGIRYIDSDGQERSASISPMMTAHNPATAKQDTFEQSAGLYWTIFPECRQHLEALCNKDYQTFRDRCYVNDRPDAEKVNRFLAKKNLRLDDEGTARLMKVLNSMEDDLTTCEAQARKYNGQIGEGESLSHRAVAYSNLSKLIGAGSSVPESKIVQFQMFGSSVPVSYTETSDGIALHNMRQAEAAIFSDWIQNSQKVDAQGAQPVYEPKVSPKCLRDLTRLQLLDYLAGTIDRPKEQILYHIDQNTKTLTGVSLVGNEAAFPSSDPARNRVAQNPPDLKFLPTSVAEEILNLKEKDVAGIFGDDDVTAKSGINVVKANLAKLQSVITTAKNDPQSTLKILPDEEFAKKTLRDLNPDGALPLLNSVSAACSENTRTALANLQQAAEPRKIEHTDKVTQAQNPTELERVRKSILDVGRKLENTDEFWHKNSDEYLKVFRDANKLLSSLRRASTSNNPENEIALEQQYKALRQSCAQYVMAKRKSLSEDSGPKTQMGRDRLLYIRQLGNLAHMRLLAIEEKKMQTTLAGAIVDNQNGQNMNPVQKKKAIAQITASAVFRELIKGKSSTELDNLAKNKDTLTAALRDANLRVQKQKQALLLERKSRENVLG